MGSRDALGCSSDLRLSQGLPGPVLVSPAKQAQRSAWAQLICRRDTQLSGPRVWPAIATAVAVVPHRVCGAGIVCESIGNIV